MSLQHSRLLNTGVVAALTNLPTGPIQATVNIGPVQPPQRKGRIP